MSPPPGPAGFPLGFFILKNVASDRVLTVDNAADADGTPLLAFPELDSSWVQGFRDPAHDNQLFFVDESGALCSKASGHAVDIQDGKPVLRRRRPISSPFPTHSSHPLPAFGYDSVTGQLTVTFHVDSSLYLSSLPSPPLSALSDRSPNRFVLTTLPVRKVRTIVDDATDFINGTANLLASPISSFFRPRSPIPQSVVTAEDVSQGEFDLREDEILVTELAPHEELDDSVDQARPVGVIELARDGSSALHMSDHSRLRAKWKIISILKEKTKTFGSSHRISI